jgi:LPXTG-motif cell wall-anchored protein
LTSKETTKPGGSTVELHTLNVHVYAFTSVTTESGTKTEQPLSGAKYILMKKEKGTDDNYLYYYYYNNGETVEWVPITSTTSNYTISESKEDGYGETVFEGISDGDYVLVEQTAPNGYNKALDTAVQIQIKDGKLTVTDGNGINMTVEVSKPTTAKESVDGESGTVAETETKTLTYDFLYKIDHKTGTELPSTGGMGTTLFYIIGAALVIGAGVLLVVRRRMGEEE